MATKKPLSTQINSYDEEFAAAAVAGAQRSSKLAGGGKYLSLSQGILKHEGQPIPGSAIDCIILDWCAHNTYYEGLYDAKNVTSPVCFAFEPDEEESLMAPHVHSLKPQHTDCVSCPKNQFGSAPNGRAGKACKNLRRLLLVPCGETKQGRFTPGKVLEPVVLGLHVPPTSTKAFDAYIKMLAHVEKRPSFGVHTRVIVTPHPTNQIEVSFEYLGKVDNSLVRPILDLRDSSAPELRAPYAPPVEKAPTVAAKAPGKRGGRY
jgi:hypothetical protein